MVGFVLRATIIHMIGSTVAHADHTVLEESKPSALRATSERWSEQLPYRVGVNCVQQAMTANQERSISCRYRVHLALIAPTEPLTLIHVLRVLTATLYFLEAWLTA